MRQPGTKFGLLMFLALGPFVSAQDTLIHAGRLIDGTATEARTKVTIVIRDQHILEIAKGFRKPTGKDVLIDLSEHTVLPGLMDMHTHLTQELSPGRYSERFRMEPADMAFRMTVYARKTLEAGFTTVRDLGDTNRLTASLRDAIASGYVVGPRIYTAGKSLATTGGHADPTNGSNLHFMGDPGPNEGVINGPSDARKAVRQRYKEGSDLIKITATGGVLSQAKNGQNPQFTEEELRTIVETARDYGFHVAAHAHGAEGMKRAIRAGVRSIEHGTFLDEEGMELMKKHGTYLVPTLMAGRHVTHMAEVDGALPEVVRPKARAIGPKIKDTFAKAYRAGVKVAFGTDSGVSAHGDNAQEFALMVQAGMKPLEAIHAATSGAATLLGVEKELGSVTAGKWADLVAVPGNPLEDITLLERIAFVMKAGSVYKQP